VNGVPSLAIDPFDGAFLAAANRDPRGWENLERLPDAPTQRHPPYDRNLPVEVEPA
jgi:hypothetical protein